MQEHLNDEFVKRAQKEGYRARAAYKLIEIDDKDKLARAVQRHTAAAGADLGCRGSRRRARREFEQG